MRGDGSITEVRNEDGTIKKGVWRVTCSLGRNAITGKRRRVSRIVHGTKEDARKVRDQLLAADSAGLATNSDVITFGEFAAEWQRRREEAGDLAERSVSESRYFVQYLTKLIGNIPLCDFNAYTIETLYQVIRDDKRKPDGSTISNRTLKKYHVYLRGIFQKAIAYDLMVSNPCDKVKPPKPEKAKRRSLTTAEAADLSIALAKSYEDASFAERARITGVQLVLATGIRLGELLGLTWKHVDLASGRIHVCQATTKTGNVKQPKSEAGDRWISLDPETLAILRAWKATQADRIGCERDQPVISDHGGYLSQNTFGHWWGTWRSRNGFDGLKIHELRHTQATLLLANGVDPKTVQNRLGHSTVTLTLDCYAHALDEKDAQAANIIGGLFARKPDFRVYRSA